MEIRSMNGLKKYIEKKGISVKEINDLRNNSGFMTIEASVIIPVILMAVMVVISGLIIIYEQGTLYAEETEALYTIPLVSIRDGNIEEHLRNISYGEGLEFGSIDVNAGYSRHKADCDGKIEYMDCFEVSSKRELDVLVDRLRRWQLYDDISEKSGEW